MLTGTLDLDCGLEMTPRFASWGLFATEVTILAIASLHEDRLSAPPGMGVDERLLCQERKWWWGI